MATIALEIERVFADHPGLGAHGFGTAAPSPTGDFHHQVQVAREWLEADAVRAMAITRIGDSYRLKHHIEDAVGTYISNGAAITAAILAGFTVQRIRREGRNCFFPSRGR